MSINISEVSRFTGFKVTVSLEIIGVESTWYQSMDVKILKSFTKARKKEMNH
jgi:hypothetical protein